MSKKKITIKDLRKHIVNTRKVKGGKIHTINTPNAGPIEIVEGNQHSGGGVNYIKTSDGVTHEIENNEVVLPTNNGPYVVSDYMNVDGTKNYNKNKTSYADLIKYLAMAGANKQDLEAVAMQTEIQNGNDPNNPTSVIKDTNVMKQPKVNLEYKEPVKKYQQITDSQGNMLVPNRMSFPNDNVFQKAGRYVGNQYLKMTGQNDAYYKQPTLKYQQTNDRQSRSGLDNFWGNLWGPKRTEVQVGGDDVRLEDKGSNIYSQNLEYNIVDGDTTGVNQYLFTNQEATRGSSDIVNTYEDGVLISSDTIPNQQLTYRDVLNYDIKSGELIITDKSGKVHKNVTQVNDPNKPSIFRKDLEGGNQVITNTTTNKEGWTYGNVDLGIYEEGGVKRFEFGVSNPSIKAESINTFRKWVNDKYPDFEYDGEGLDPEGGDNKYVQHALKLYGEEFLNDMHEGNYSRDEEGYLLNYPTQTTTSDTSNVSLEEINKLLKKKYKQPLTRKYQQTDEDWETIPLYPTEYQTDFKGTTTNIPTDYMFPYDESLIPITEADGSFTAMTDWTHSDHSLTEKNVQPTQAELNARGFQNFDQWRAWVKTHEGYENYDFGNTKYWGPKHQQAWKKMSGPPEPVVTKETISGPCVGPGCDDPSSFSSNTTVNNKLIEDGDGGTKIPWKGIGIGALALGGIYGLSKLGKGDSAVDFAMEQDPNLIQHINIPEARLALQNNANELAMIDRERWSNLQNLRRGYNPTGAQMSKAYEISEASQAAKSKSYADLFKVNTGISNQEAKLNVAINTKEAEINSKIDVANQLEMRDIREQRIAALDAKHNRRMALIRDVIKLGGQGLEAWATLKDKPDPLTKDDA